MKMQLLVVFWQESALHSAKDFRTDQKMKQKVKKVTGLTVASLGHVEDAPQLDVKGCWNS